MGGCHVWGVALTFGNIGVFSHKKAAFAGGHFAKNDFQYSNGGGDDTPVEQFSVCVAAQHRECFCGNLVNQKILNGATCWYLMSFSFSQNFSRCSAM